MGRYLQSVLGGSVLVNGQQIISLPYVLLLTMLAVVYIGNNYYAHHKIREVNRLEDEMKELRFEYRSTNSRLMFESKQSEVARKLDGTGIRESTEPPKKLFSNPNKDN
ncbi:MAG: FtsL-like putative cell division protein [Bacteroidales bacterium]